MEKKFECDDGVIKVVGHHDDQHPTITSKWLTKACYGIKICKPEWDKARILSEAFGAEYPVVTTIIVSAPSGIETQCPKKCTFFGVFYNEELYTHQFESFKSDCDTLFSHLCIAICVGHFHYAVCPRKAISLALETGDREAVLLYRKPRE